MKLSVFMFFLLTLAKKYLRKGSLILLEGEIRYSTYEDKEGITRRVTEIAGDQLILLSRRVPEEEAGTASDEESLPF